MAVYYVDASSTHDGDGTTAAQAASGGATGAWNVLGGKSLSATDVVWVRRSGTAEALGAALIVWDGDLNGWPLSTDAGYAARPASGTSNGWDADSSDDYAEFTTSNNSYYLHRDSGTAAVNITRLHILSTGTHGKCLQLGDGSSSGVEDTTVRYCKFECSSTSSSAYNQLLTIDAAAQNTFQDCVFLRSTGSTVTGTSARGLVYMDKYTAGDNKDTLFLDCSFDGGKIADAYSTNGGVFLGMVDDSSSGDYVGRLTFDNCTFTGEQTADKTSTTADPWFNFRGAGPYTMVDCTITDSAAASFSKLTILTWNDREHGGLTTERLKLVKGGLVSIAYGDGTKIDIINSTWVQGSSAHDYCLLIASHDTLVTVRSSTFATSGTANIGVTGDYCHAHLIGCTTSGTASSVTGIGSHLTTTGAGANEGIWNTTGYVGSMVADSGVTRSGGSSFAIRGDPGPYASLGQRAAISVGSHQRPTIFLAASAGARTFTLYAAHKNYSGVTPTGNGVWFDVIHMDGSSQLVIASSKGGALTADTSTWSGDTGLTEIKLNLAVTIASTQKVSVVIYFSAEYEATAYWYIDPLVVVA